MTVTRKTLLKAVLGVIVLAALTVTIGVLTHRQDAYAATTGKGGQSGPVAGCTLPSNKGEARAYAKCVKAHDDSQRLDFDHKLNGDQSFVGDIKLEQEVRELVEKCQVCVVELPPANPAPILTELQIPNIQGDDSAPLSDADRAAIDNMEEIHNTNQENAWAYLMYFEQRIDYYTHPRIECPPVVGAPPVVCTTCVTPPVITPSPGPGPGPGPGPSPCPQKICGGAQQGNQSAPKNGSPIPNPPALPPGSGGASKGTPSTGTAPGDSSQSGSPTGPGAPGVVHDPNKT